MLVTISLRWESEMVQGGRLTKAPVPLVGDATALARRTKKIADTR